MIVFFQAHGTELVVESEVDVLQGVIAGIDGEKDPRCLMLSFQLAQQVICIYEQAASQVQPSCPQQLDAASQRTQIYHTEPPATTWVEKGRQLCRQRPCFNLPQPFTLHTVCCCAWNAPPHVQVRQTCNLFCIR